MSITARIAALVAVLLSLCTAAAAPARGGEPAAGQLAPEALLARYQPVTVLDRFERFAPTSVDGFVAGSALYQTGTIGEVEPAPAGLPVHGDGWWLDRRGCSPSAGLTALACYDAQDAGPSTVYGRYEVRAGTIVLQYWFFYEFNFWSLQYPPSGFAWQAHEGDWEVVTVLLDDKQSPVEAAYSQHCTGERRRWADVEKVDGHPVVYVATGSHANLFAPGLHPISLTCYPPPIQAILRQNNVTPLDFLVFPGRVLGPGATAVERVHDNAPRWLRFPGTWGEAQFINIPPPIGSGTVPFGTSPDGPAFHDVWSDPLGTIARYPAG